MKSNPRTKEEFENWYNQNDGDPWGYNTPYLLSILDSHVDFIAANTNLNFNGTIVEFGAFKGDTTLRLASKFRQANILANEISSLAMEELKRKTASLNKITYSEEDMTQFIENEKNKSIENPMILVLECLYYLYEEERWDFLKKIRTTYPNATIFLSAPIIGGKYITENQLYNFCKKNACMISNKKVLTLSVNNILAPLYRRLANVNSWCRKKLAHQVIYCIQPKP